MKNQKQRLTFGLVVDWITGWGDDDYYQTKILSGVEDFARENNINLVSFVTGRLGSPFEWERRRNILLDFITSSKIDGIIALPQAFGVYGTDSAVSELLIQSKFRDLPIVTIGDGLEGFHSVRVDNQSGMTQVIDHLIDVHGCSKIAFIKGMNGSREAESRFKAYLDSLEKHQIPFDPKLIYQGDFLYETGSKAMGYFLDQGTDFDALAASNDNMAIGALTEYHNRLGKIPENLPITGFDDAEASRVHSLTTVRQSFIDQARDAANMLLHLIRGEDVSMTGKVSTEMVLRSSCGCIPAIVMNVTDTKEEADSDSFENLFRKHKSKMLADMQAVSCLLNLHEQEAVQVREYEERLLNALLAEIQWGNQNEFYKAWNSIIFWVILKKINLSFLHDLLSNLRLNIISGLSANSDIIKAENLFQIARIQISYAIQRTGATLGNYSSIQTDGLERLGEDLVANLSLEDQMDLIYEKLPEFEIETCYLTLYENNEKPLEYSRLILAFNEQERFDTGKDGIRFRTPDLLPDKLFAQISRERFSLIVQALHQGDYQIGAIVFGYKGKVNKAFEIIRYRLSASLKSSFLIKSIQNQALEMEKKVIERTKELSRSNEQLTAEIGRRENAEAKLKKAMHDLEIYNKELHFQSIRDELTGIYNRRGFMTLGMEQYEIAKSNRQGFLLLFADLDGLKRINDNFGHAEGDSAIIKTAELLGRLLKEADIFARLGGDEFTALVTESNIQDVVDIRKRLKEAADDYNKTSGKPYDLSISIGSAYYDPDVSIPFEELLKKADKSLYKEKTKR
jgi:diguanylate cyclase (GGDEF)-like protein